MKEETQPDKMMPVYTFPEQLVIARGRCNEIKIQ